jgi:uncharacterized membrane protein HdeD (DUF308 family)
MIDENQKKRERAQAVAASVRAGVSSKLGSIWWSFLLRGIFAVALGIFALFWPTLSLSILAFAVGLYCVADGAVGLFGALRYPELREYLVQALVVLGIGAVLIIWPGATLRIVLLFLGVAALLAGIGQILTARQMVADDPERGVVMTIGIAAAIVGLVLVFWPGSGIVVISWVIGIAAILIGALLIYLGSRFKRLEARVGMPT